MNDLIEVGIVIMIYCVFIYTVISIIDVINTFKWYKTQFDNIKIGDIITINICKPNSLENINIDVKIFNKQGNYIYYSYIDAQKGELKFKNHYIFFMWIVNDCK